MKNILFLCTGNSCRSQMAEGWAKHFYGKSYNFYSAGIEKHGLNQRAVQVMIESGVDISNQFSKTLVDLSEIQFDLVITVCEHASEKCPIFNNAPQVFRAEFDDPPKLAQGLREEEKILFHYRRVRDEIRKFVQNYKF